MKLFVAFLFAFQLLICNANYALNIKYYKSADKNKDGKLSGHQFIDATIQAINSAGMEKDKDMIEDIAIDFMNKKGFSDQSLIPLAEVETWISTGEFLKFFKTWREAMFKELMKAKEYDSKDKLWRESALKSPSSYGLKYKDYKQLKPSPQLNPSRKHDL
ncbi:unnamed protein product [Blepharisma stoltei]|uniref:EF-hand domain-containing protein n=1 Tax=Blepharisma stoltei TaxID=1481888 RepID=A0AAU9JRR9_9CILI|nr:unnamed protein product [Blepharisma stoltei]